MDKLLKMGKKYNKKIKKTTKIDGFIKTIKRWKYGFDETIKKYFDTCLTNKMRKCYKVCWIFSVF